MSVDLRSALLPFTLSNAARLTFYRELWQGFDLGAVRTPADLWALPTVSKAHYRRGLMFDPDVVSGADYISHTTGTTGDLTWRHRTRAEAAVIASLFGREFNHGQLVLTIRVTRHGMELPVPGGGHSLPGGISDDMELDQCLQMLRQPQSLGGSKTRPTVIAGGGEDVALLGQAVLEREGPNLSVQRLVIGGFATSGLARHLALAFPRASLVERFSLSEVFGGATRTTPTDGAFVTDPHVLAEVIDDDDQPVGPNDIGELTLTELFPFVQLQPLIRYRTGDLVRNLGSTEDGRIRFKWWGRRSACVREGERGPWVLGECPLADALSEDELVARAVHRPQICSIRSKDVGTPLVAVQPGAPPTVLIGVRANPWLNDAQLRNLAMRIKHALHPELLTPLRVGFIHVPTPSSHALVWTTTGVLWT